MPQTFNDYDVRPLIGPLWRAGGPNSAATATSAQIKVSSLALTAGDTYEVEAALAETAGHARALAVVQDLFRVKRQLTPPVDPNLLYERRPPRITALQPLETLALFAVGERAEERLGLGQPREPLGLTRRPSVAAKRFAVSALMGGRGRSYCPVLCPRCRSLSSRARSSRAGTSGSAGLERFRRWCRRPWSTSRSGSARVTRRGGRSLERSSPVLPGASPLSPGSRSALPQRLIWLAKT